MLYNVVATGKSARAVRVNRIFTLLRETCCCGHCVPPWEIAAINFNQLPWLRFHNYPIEAGFRCPVCRRLTTMHVMYYDIPNTGGDKPMYDD